MSKTNPIGMLNPVDLIAPKPTPATPDYEGAAIATSEGDLKNAELAINANRPTMINPFGSSVWSKETSPDTYQYESDLAKWERENPLPVRSDYPNNMIGEGMFQAATEGYQERLNVKPEMTDYVDWTNKVTLSPEQQAIFDAQQKNQLGTLDLASQGLEQMQGIFSTPFNTADYGTRPTYEGLSDPLDTYAENREKVREAMLARVDQDIAVDRDNLHSSLIAKGIPEGSLAYQNAMREVDRKQTDARQQAEIKATEMANMEYSASLAGRQQMNAENMDKYNTGYQDYRTDVQDALLNRQTPLNEYSAFSTGNQVTNPSFQPFSQQQTTAGPDILGATTAAGAWDTSNYNAQEAGRQNTQNNLFTLGGSYFMGGK